MEEILLNNGVRMTVDDRTAVLTGDLYMVHLVFTTEVCLGDGDGELKEFCGEDKAKLVRELKRPAVHEKDLEQERARLRESFLATNLPYMGKPRFPARFKAKILRDFREAEEKRKREHG
jgi:hypothetical protein